MKVVTDLKLKGSKVKVIADIKNYKSINNRIRELLIKIDNIDQKKQSDKMAQRIESTGILFRLNNKLDILTKLRYEMECNSFIIRSLAILNLI